MATDTIETAAATLPPQLNGISGGGDVELGQIVTLTVVYYSSSEGLTYQWRKGDTTIPGATAASYIINNAAPADAGTYTITVTNSAGASVATTEVRVKAAAAPVIINSPGSLTRQVGQKATFGFTATGSYPRTHQWRKNGVDIPGATQPTYVIESLATTDVGMYSVVVANNLGSATSNSASLTVNAATPVVIASSYPSDQAATQGASVSLNVYLSSGSDPYTFQWLKEGVAIPGATGASLILNPVMLSDAGKYAVIVTNAAGSATSRQATLTVTLPIPVTFQTQPRSETIYEGQDVSLNVSVSGSSPLTLQWHKDGTAITGATGSWFSLAKAKLSDAGNYTVVATNPAGSVTSNVATLVVNRASPPVITQQPASQTIAYGSNLMLSVQASGTPPLQFQWKKDGVDLGSWSSSSYEVYQAKPTNSGIYTVVVTNAAGSVTSAAASITVQQPVAPTITKEPLGQSIPYGEGLYLVVEAKGSPPLSYQWKKDGVSLGSAASYYSYSVYNATPEHSGNYSVVVTNPAGSVTSATAVVTVQPAVAPTIARQPVGQTIAYDSTIQLSVEAKGSPTLRYQWFKDGVSLGSSASSSYFYIHNATPAHSGAYTVTVTNVAGTVTSAAATVTVEAAIAPKITEQPKSQTVPFAGNVNLYVQATGSSPLTVQWKKNGTPLSSNYGTSYYVFDATPEDSGIYTVTITNAAGSVTSTGATVTVQAAVPPKITTQPVSTQVPVGKSLSLSASVDGTGAGSLRYQWYRNGVAIAGATSSYFNLSAVQRTDAGDYKLVVTGIAGSATSQVAKVTVLPPAPPSVSSWPSEFTGRLGQSASISIYSVEGSPPLSYQWAKDGVPIAGATSYSLNISSVAAKDFGDYTLTIWNAGGIITSPPIRLRVSQYDTPAATPWLDAARVGDIIYFLGTSPARIDRYDIAGEGWLPRVILSETLIPTAFVPTADAVYIAYGRKVVRRPLNLATETPIANTATDVTHAFVIGDYLYVGNASSYSTSASYDSINRSTLAAGPTVSLRRSSGVSLAPTVRKAFGRNLGSTPANIVSFAFAADGTLAATGQSPHYTVFPTATRTFVFPDQELVGDNSGTIYWADDLTYAGSFGSAYTDLAFLSDGTPVLLRNQTLVRARRDNFFETAYAPLAQAGHRIFTRGTSVFVFGELTFTGGNYHVAKILGSAFTVPAARGLADAPIGRYSTDDVFVGENDTVHVFSRTLQSLVRWSASKRSFLPSIVLRAAPALASHQPGGKRLMLAYSDGAITELPLGTSSPAERQIATLNLQPRAMVDLSDRLVLNTPHAQSSGDARLVLDSGGHATQLQWEGSYYARVLAWQPSSLRLYSGPKTYGSSSMQYETVSASGDLPTTAVTSTVSPLNTPLRFNPDGSLAATGNGRVLNADLAQVGVLSNDVTDAAWLDDGLYTMRKLNGETEVQQWARATYLPTRSLSLPGLPLRLCRIPNNQLVAITTVDGIPAFTVLNAGLAVSTAAPSPITISAQPESKSTAPAGSATFSTSQTGAGGTVTYRWLHNGAQVSGATSASLSLASVQPTDAGFYTGIISDSSSTVSTQPAVLGVTTTAKVIGSGQEIGPNIGHPNGNVYDQVALKGTAACVTADAGQVVRISFIDLNDDIVQVEFSGAGTLSLVLDGATGPAASVNYNQPDVQYMKGHATIVITGADESTNLGVFSVGRGNAVNQSLFHPDVNYDGVADLAGIGILSTNGNFGGVRVANVNFFNNAGPTGIYAPGVKFTGPVYVGNINAFGDATPMLIFGSAPDVQITGGDLLQTNSRPIKVAGMTQLKFVDGTTSHSVTLEAQTNHGRFDQNGTDVTAQIVVNPNP